MVDAMTTPLLGPTRPPAPPPGGRVVPRPAVGQARINAAKTHCRAGHAYVAGNVYVVEQPKGSQRFKRRCRTCTLTSMRMRRVPKPPRPPGPRGQALLSLASTTCARGHKWDEHGYVRKSGPSAGTRICGLCQKQRAGERERTRQWEAQRERIRIADAERQDFERRWQAQRMESLRQMVARRTAQAGVGPANARRRDMQPCAQCGELFAPQRASRAKYCGDACKQRANYVRRTSRSLA